MNSNKPLVSCIMPTANRGKFIRSAINNFLRQDYLNKELVIVDDGEESIISMLPDSPQIKYTRLLTNKNTIGYKRNHACKISQGEIIIHWDDDDWYASNWVSYQIDTLIKTDADICGLSQLFFYDPIQGKAWKYTYPSEGRPWVAGATMAYKKEFWSQNPFRHIQIGEDNLFVWNLNAKVFAHTYTKGFISFLHPNNTSPKYIHDSSRWEPYSINEIIEILP